MLGMAVLFVGALAASVIIVITLFAYADSGCDTRHKASFGIALVGAVLTLTMAMSGVSGAWAWVDAEYEARVLNKEYGTSYTREDVLWAGDIIRESRSAKAIGRALRKKDGDAQSGEGTK